MPNHPIPIIEARGTHREVGQQIGTQCKPQIERMMDLLRKSPPKDKTWEMTIAESKLFLAHSQAIYPQYVEELQGIAEGSGIPFDELFVSMCEELWETPPNGKGCTDMAARGRAARGNRGFPFPGGNRSRAARPSPPCGRDLAGC